MVGWQLSPLVALGSSVDLVALARERLAVPKTRDGGPGLAAVLLSVAAVVIFGRGEELGLKMIALLLAIWKSVRNHKSRLTHAVGDVGILLYLAEMCELGTADVAEVYRATGVRHGCFRGRLTHLSPRISTSPSDPLSSIRELAACSKWKST